MRYVMRNLMCDLLTSSIRSQIRVNQDQLSDNFFFNIVLFFVTNKFLLIL